MVCCSRSSFVRRKLSKKKMAAPALVTARANSSVRDDGIFATRLMANDRKKRRKIEE